MHYDQKSVTSDAGRAFSLAGAAWAISSYYQSGDSDARAGILVGDGTVLALPDGLGVTALELLSRWDDVREDLKGLDLAALPPVEDARLDLLLRYPGKVMCAGANYHGHLAEMGAEPPSDGDQPFFFLKSPSTTLVAPGEPIRIRADAELKLDWEAELGAVIGRRTVDVDVKDALEAVAGYIVLNDVTNRAALRRETAIGPAFAYDWVSAKSLDNSCPISAALVPAHLVPDPQDLQVRTWVNGVPKQDSRTSDMVYDLRTLIAAASRIFTLEPGDIIATGTPAGVGIARGESLTSGDIVTVEVSGVGSVSNPVQTSIRAANQSGP
jgi:2-keto-4-pentenoate hydratase/2-oxohepta-3-ene-1,7-dioic acid hydratase in catechol pathway